MIRTKYTLTLLYTFMSLLQYCNTTDESHSCVQKSPCECDYGDGKYLNLMDIGKDNKFLEADTEHYVYYFHLCTDVQLNVTERNLTKNECEKPLSLCVFNKTNRTLTKLGSANDLKFIQDGGKDKPDVVFTNGADTNATTTVVTISCSDVNVNVLSSLSAERQLHRLFLSSPSACVQTHHHHEGISTGSLLLVLLFVFGSIYFIGGALVLRLLRGARGKEMIPNLDFWMDLPALVRDGVLFILRGFSATTTADSYDRI